MRTILTVILAILAFCFLIIMHELGHFTACKLAHVRVNEFWLGMGPVLFRKQIGETEFSLRALPIGGACVMEGEDEEQDTPGSFNHAGIFWRMLIVAAGALMNFVIGFVIVLLIVMPTKQMATTTIDSLAPGFAGEGMLLPGDQILKVDGYHILLNSDFVTALSRGKDTEYDIEVRRNGEKVKLTGVPVVLRQFEGEDRARYGVNFALRETNLADNLQTAFYMSVNFARLVWMSLGDLVTGKVGVDQLSGPLGVTAVMSEAAHTSMPSFWMLLAFISINLGVMNLLPLPALDGGRLLFLVIELISRRKVPAKYEGFVHAAGLALLMLLMLYVTFQDVVRLFMPAA